MALGNKTFQVVVCVKWNRTKKVKGIMPLSQFNIRLLKNKKEGKKYERNGIDNRYENF